MRLSLGNFEGVFDRVVGLVRGSFDVGKLSYNVLELVASRISSPFVKIIPCHGNVSVDCIQHAYTYDIAMQ